MQTGRRFRSTCDTEVIVNGFAEWGEAVVDRLQGMFAFGIWDKQTGSLFLARDRTGMKPLFYAKGPHGIAFASGACVINALGLGSGLDPEAAALYFVFGYVPSP